MALSKEEIEAFRDVVRDELKQSNIDSTVSLLRRELRDFREDATALEATHGHDLAALRESVRQLQASLDSARLESQQNFDALFKRDETREQEYLSVVHQLAELEKKVA